MIPKLIHRALEHQDLSILYEVRDFLEALIAEQEKSEEPRCSAGREVLKEERVGTVTYRLERISCGKNCKGCPHGPYWYGYWREGGKTRSKYIGKELVKQT